MSLPVGNLEWRGKNSLQTKKIYKTRGLDFSLYLRPIYGASSHAAVETVNKGRWKPISSNKLGVSYLFFANDLILFGEVTLQSDNINE